MNEDFMELYTDNGSYLSSLIASRRHLSNCAVLLEKLDELISAEIDLGLIGADKAKSEVLKLGKTNNLKPIK